MMLIPSKYFFNYVHFRMTDVEHPGRKITYWKNKLLINTVAVFMIVSVFAVIPGVIMSAKQDLYGLLAVDVFVVSSFYIIGLGSGMTLKFRKTAFVFSLYLLSVTILYYLGSFGPGLIYLLAVSVFASLVEPVKKVRCYVLLNILICVLFGFGIYYELLPQNFSSTYSLGSWIAVSVNVIIISAVFAYVIPQLFYGLEKSFLKQRILQSKLEVNKQELETAYRNAVMKNVEMEQFAKTVSHDLQEPVRMIVNLLDHYKDKYSSKVDDKGNKFIDFAVTGANRIRRIVTDLLVYYNIDKIETDQKFELLPILKVLEDVQSVNRKQIKNKNVEVNFEGELQQHVRREALLPVIQSLFENSLRYNNDFENLKIYIKVVKQNTNFVFEFFDNGKGMSESESKTAFLLFNRLGKRIDETATGTGLALSKKIVEFYDGIMHPISSEPGSGCTVSFEFPENSDIWEKQIR